MPDAPEMFNLWLLFHGHWLKVTVPGADADQLLQDYLACKRGETDPVAWVRWIGRTVFDLNGACAVTADLVREPEPVEDSNRDRMAAVMEKFVDLAEREARDREQGEEWRDGGDGQ